MIQVEEFAKVDMRVGTIVEASINKKARKLDPMHIGSVKSEVRILGSESEQGVVLLQLSEPVQNGDRIF